jgi:hypothetical protein
MSRRSIRADVERISQVLAGLDYPAAKWQLIMCAEEYGADAGTRAQLWSLRAGSYPGLAAVLGALGLTDGPPPLRSVSGRGTGRGTAPMAGARRRTAR